MRDLSEEELDQLPLHCLSNELEKVRHLVPKDSEGVPIVSCSFDPYLSCIVAPDHLLFGLGQDIVRAMLCTLRPSQRDKVNELATQALAKTGYNAESSLIGSGSYHVHQMSITSFANYMLVVPWSVRIVLGVQPIDCTVLDTELERISIQELLLHALFLFQKLRAQTFYIPQASVDGLAEVHKMDEDNGKVYQQHLKEMAVKYVGILNILCGKNARVRMEVDKPNAHRLLELYFHSIPRVGHASLIQELILESGHQPLKRAISRSNGRESHQYAMQKVLADDWKRRLGVACHSISDIYNVTDAECRMISEVAFGRGDIFESGKASFDEIRSSFPPHVLKKYKSLVSPSDLMLKRTYTWWGRQRVPVGTRRHCISCESVLDFLTHLSTPSSGNNCSAVFEYGIGVLSKVEEQQQGAPLKISCSRFKKSRTVSRGSIVQVLVETIPLSTNNRGEVKLLVPASGEGTRTYWYIQSLYANCNGYPLYAHVLPMQCVDSSPKYERRFQVDQTSKDRHVVRLTENVYRCLALHEWNSTELETCLCERVDEGYAHSRQARDHSLIWTILGTKEGFPPRGR